SAGPAGTAKRMNSLSAGKWRPRSRSALGTSTCRPEASRIRRSRSARRASRALRCSRNSPTRRATLKAAVWRATTTAATSRKRSSHNTSQWRPLTFITHPEDAQLGAPRPRVRRDLAAVGQDRLPRLRPPERAAAAGADRLVRRADTPPPPILERVLHDPVLTGMIADHGQPAARDQRVPERGQGVLQALQLVADRHADRLEDPG